MNAQKGRELLAYGDYGSEGTLEILFLNILGIPRKTSM